MKKLILILIISPILLLGQPKVLLQILGSGGPESGDKRASTAYHNMDKRKKPIL